jgi:methylated-DNA-[protein]-cysteine S-methyltransferase
MESVLMAVDYLVTPIGILKITANDAGLLSVKFVDSRENKVDANGHTTECRQQLSEYFSGQRREFDLSLANSGTVFQQAVWGRLLNISFGETASYQQIAKQINNPQAVRAVGAANGKNPIFVIVPGHRVIGANGSLTGYAGGLDRKRWLLQHEGALV